MKIPEGAAADAAAIDIAMPIIVRHLQIRGLVQGVYYRQSMVEQSRLLGVTGWVRNRLDGSVEAIVRGTPEQVAAIMAWSRRGPPAAQVSEVIVAEAQGEFDRFEWLATR